QADRDQGDREEVQWVGEGVRDKEDGGQPDSKDPGEEDGKGPTGGRERPCVMEGWHEREKDGAEGEESGEKLDQLDLAGRHRRLLRSLWVRVVAAGREQAARTVPRRGSLSAVRPLSPRSPRFDSRGE